MVGNITVGIVVLLIVGGIIFGCRIDHQATKEADEKNNSAVKYFLCFQCSYQTIYCIPFAILYL